MPTVPSVAEVARIWNSAGISTIPILDNGTKRPAVEWALFQGSIPGPDLLDRWWGNSRRYGLALICGKVSGNLEMTELESRATGVDSISQLVSALEDRNASHIWSKLTGPTGYSEHSPSGGLHLIYRISDHVVPGNERIAKTEYNLVLAETRGEGGYVIVAPTPGACHPTGESWTKISGEYGTVASITWHERNVLHQALRSALDRTPPPPPTVRTPPPPVARSRTGLSPGDDFEARTSWAEILEPHGWTIESRRGDEIHWTRPGKNPREGSSATTGHADDRDRLYVFSTSTIFEAETSYTKFSAYALLNHRGDHTEAAKDLAAQGYGQQTPFPDLPELPPLPGDPENIDQESYVSSWAPVELDALLDGTGERKTPTLMPRDDGACLLYPKLVHWFHGESESGKSMVAQHECVRVLNNGGNVTYIDFEDDEFGVVGRFLDMGADKEAIRRGLRYLRPDVSPRASDEDRIQYVALMEQPADLVIVDGVTEALGIFALSGRDEQEVAGWIKMFLRRLAQRTGAAVIAIDHVTKDPDTRGRFAIGSQHKMAGVDGAAYMFDVEQPLGKGLKGIVTMRIAKDRPGGVRPTCGGYRKSDRTQEAARITIDSTGEGIQITVGQPQNQDEENDGFRPTVLMERVSIWLERQTDPVTGHAITESVTGKRAHLISAIEALVFEGYVTRTHKGPSRFHISARPYRQVLDPKSDRYAGSLEGGIISGMYVASTGPSRWH